VETLLGRATVLSRLRRHPEAVAALERARQLDPQNPRVAALLAAERSRAEDER
jgi:cytochrome c-type biogenesis protein CcmH/NrfG